MTLYEVCHWQQKTLYEKLLREDFIWNFQAASPKKQSHRIQQQMTVTIREKMNYDTFCSVVQSCGYIRLKHLENIRKFENIVDI